jgi:hypothetical protein
MSSKIRAKMVICDHEFRLAIQAMPVWELHLPREKKELERYLRIVDDFAESHHYKTLSMSTLHSLVDGSITWPWD